MFALLRMMALPVVAPLCVGHTAQATTLSISANPASVTSGAVSTLTWSSTNTTSCAGSGAWSGVKAKSGSQSVIVPNGLSTYALSCSGTAGSASNGVVIGAGATPPALYLLNVSLSGSGTVTSNPSGIACGATCSASYPSGAAVTLSAAPAAGYTFSGWSGACTGTGACTTTLSAARSVTATFALTTPSIASVAAACAAEPMRGNVFYYCDCGTGAEAGCVAGNDANAGTSASAPRRTIANAAARFSSLAVNDTVALCKGGAFDSAGDNTIGSNRCGAGVACNDLREYAPTIFAGTAKPIINNAPGEIALFRFQGTGGIRLLNLALKGGAATAGTTNQAFFLYRGAHDVTMCNLDMDAFDLTVYNESGGVGDAPTMNIKLTGSRITNSRVIAYLGGGINDDVSYNYWDGNGSSNVFDHTLYFASAKELQNMRIVGNYVRGQYGSTCLGAPIVAHMEVDGLLVKDNVVDIAASAITGGCWGIAFNNFTGATEPIYHRNAVFSGNTIKNGGNTALTVTGCPNCLIENNLIIHETSMGASGIVVATGPARTAPADDVNTQNTIRNNTIWYGPNANQSGIGIVVGTEGTGHIIANNSVTYSGTSTGNNGPFNCYQYPLALASYAFINNNHCNSAANYNWEATRGSLAAWRTYSAASGFDTVSITLNPLFTAAGTNFTPSVGSPLIGAGSALYGSLFDMFGKARTNPPAIGAVEGN